MAILVSGLLSILSARTYRPRNKRSRELQFATHVGQRLAATGDYGTWKRIADVLLAGLTPGESSQILGGNCIAHSGCNMTEPSGQDVKPRTGILWSSLPVAVCFECSTGDRR